MDSVKKLMETEQKAVKMVEDAKKDRDLLLSKAQEDAENTVRLRVQEEEKYLQELQVAEEKKIEILEKVLQEETEQKIRELDGILNDKDQLIAELVRIVAMKDN
ncbi:hypothetical protein SLOPH_1181 [Spraguea lophii 42_110]|uniref:Uncharacterized protein n=1 Tax=Spraguea lophii (strain 42_110) TaxID=1358809 RepID=S7WDV4_SPRLO|nr:hypothetical protein SLOPH_1181 [Spraguea lophii 42_110]